MFVYIVKKIIKPELCNQNVAEIEQAITIKVQKKRAGKFC
jgi:hypothetical protein